MSETKSLRGFAAAMLSALGIWGGMMMQSEAVAADTGERTMTIVRIYTGADNQSHFEDVRIPLKSTGKIGFMSELMKATGIVFRETGGDYNYDFHTAPLRRMRFVPSPTSISTSPSRFTTYWRRGAV